METLIPRLVEDVFAVAVDPALDAAKMQTSRSAEALAGLQREGREKEEERWWNVEYAGTG